ncbi:MAG: magnesium/cobalt transporter CorA [Candidatus Caenarcaniphilales bacterium]|jgi:magnesium transporter|nr:magnesium/cobalt transporter CorA [Candidatus Caenarcaniphilales bacterium]
MTRKSKAFVRNLSSIGKPPGSLPESLQNDQDLTVLVNNISYDQNNYTKNILSDQQQLIEKLESIKNGSNFSVEWIDIETLKDLHLVKTIGETLEIHPLILEDITHTHQRPKFEDWDNYIYLVVRMIYLNSSEEIIQEQVSFILGANFLISFQEFDGDVFNVIRKRLESNKGRVRRMGADYLMYSLLDAIADNYFLVIDSINEKLILLEEQINSENSLSAMKELQNLKQEALLIRRYALPFKEMTTLIMKEESNLLQAETVVFFKDLQDHLIQILDSLDILREICLSMFETYRSVMNNKMNEIMKVLTVFSAIFMPITFIVGVYGMNFKYMPELESHLGYPIVWLIMVVVVAVMLLAFKKNKWL